MSCGNNIFNEGGDSGVYECDNVGSGIGLFAGENITPTETTFNFKSLVAGSNINITSTADEVEISSDGVNSVTNIGVGTGQVLVDVLAGSVRARTLTGTLGIDVATSSSLVTIQDESIQTLSNVEVYNYGCISPVNLFPGYVSPSGVVSNNGQIMDYYSGNVVATSIDTIDFYPNPRVTEPSFYNFTTLATNGSQSFGTVKMFPNILYTNDPAMNYTLASGSDGLLYQLPSQNRMINYDSSLVSLTGIAAIALDISDNILFYTTTASPNTINYYDFTTKTSTVLFNVTAINGWTVGAVICDMHFQQHSHTLYVKGDTSSRYLFFCVKPFVRSEGLQYFTPATVGQNYTLTGGITHSLALSENEENYVAYTPSSGNTQVSQTFLVASGSTGFVNTTTPEANNGIQRLFFASDGTLRLYSQTTNNLYQIARPGSILTGFTLVTTLSRTYISFTRSPYGIRVAP